jgi:predicted nucleic acid-binding Zn ribbon protein
MIVIALLFCCDLCFEWGYLQQKKRKRRTYLLVLGTAAIVFLVMETLYYFREQPYIVNVIETVFGPIDKFIKMEQ